MGINFESGKPLFIQLEELIRTDIARGKYKPGERLPGVRDMAMSFSVNPNTMQRALLNLEGEGLLITRGTSGRFVCNDPAIIHRARKYILRSLAVQFLDKCETFDIGDEEAFAILTEARNNHQKERTYPDDK